MIPFRFDISEFDCIKGPLSPKVAVSIVPYYFSFLSLLKLPALRMFVVTRGR